VDLYVEHYVDHHVDLYIQQMPNIAGEKMNEVPTFVVGSRVESLGSRVESLDSTRA
jgi:hypothetical protein